MVLKVLLGIKASSTHTTSERRVDRMGVYVFVDKTQFCKLSSTDVTLIKGFLVMAIVLKINTNTEFNVLPLVLRIILFKFQTVCF